ncbi:MAG: pyruvate, phosphate dikinase [Candidatus Obscuribacter sp.]|nr:pyruvate, phosphate dikinase [Candidatus Obscuribacter sp.]MBP6593740.1 pyruvate, phosphate dikinase [Candidatus Obscuribacter sp.]
MTEQSSKSTTKKLTRRVYLFEEGYEALDGDREAMKEAFGGKGAGLAEMTRSGVNVPPGLTILTTCCREYTANGGKMLDGLMDEVNQQLAHVEAKLDRKLGDLQKPLLLSVRSGAKFSMPGMMDTILNLGLNDKTVESLAKLTDNPRFAWDSYRRFIQMYSNVVLEISKDQFEDILEDMKDELKVHTDSDLTVENLKKLVVLYKAYVLKKSGKGFPQDTKVQLSGAIEAVFRSWNNNRAVYYRNLNKIDHNLGTAVNVQSMVFGNFDNNSATGVCFTRNPSTGEKLLYGEYLTNAQGEDVVAGVRTPKKIVDMAAEMPKMYEELLANIGRLEKYYRDMQDIEFTIEQGKLFLLQTRNGKRTAAAAIKVAVDMVKEEIISKEEALMRVEPLQLNQLLLPSFVADDKQKAKTAGRLLATGLNASPGAAIGKIVFNPDEAEKRALSGEKIILVRIETCPDDIHGLVPAQGVITSRGGMTSHAAVVARGMGKPCVAGCEALKINLDREEMVVGTKTFKNGDIVSIDGTTGEIFEGAILTSEPDFSEDFRHILQWADSVRRLGIRTNADTPADAKLAREFGAEGIGLCRTEHMFMSHDRLPVVQKMILSVTDSERQEALDKLLPMQRDDFYGIFKAMDGLPVTIRLLDPPLHEFLPKEEELIEAVATMRAKGVTGPELRTKETLLDKVRELKESNPMMGLRGCRLGLVFPQINKMQVRAIFEAAIAVQKEGIKVLPEIMIPLVGHVNELKFARITLESVAKEVMAEAKVDIAYKFGTMIEIPRAALTADAIAEYAEFFSFGTNDLTQMTFGYSRDDAEGKFLQRYLDGVDIDGVKNKVLQNNPFEVLDTEGVGKLMKIAVELGLKTRPDLKLGICGEHGGEPSSIAFAHQIGLAYVSCSPFRVPVARLAAAQANLTGVERDK